MKKSLVWLVSSLLLSHQVAMAQPKPAAPAAQYGIVEGSSPTSNLTKFDLGFPGGTPTELVRAIEKASGKPLNAIVPDEHAGLALPALRMKRVDIPQLFEALNQASVKNVIYESGYQASGGVRRPITSTFMTRYGFKTQGAPTDDAIWYFYHEKPILPTQSKVDICRFWQVAPYLEKFKIEDITTAVQTGFKMLGEASPAINFHQDTKLLIAVGEEEKLKLIDSVLAELEREVMPSKSSSQTQPVKPAEPAKR